MLVSLTCMCLNRHFLNIRIRDPYENIFQLFLVDKVFCKYLKKSCLVSSRFHSQTQTFELENFLSTDLEVNIAFYIVGYTHLSVMREDYSVVFIEI